MEFIRFWKYIEAIYLSVCIYSERVSAYYKKINCYGTGDCIFVLNTGGLVDDQSRWVMECHDGEALIGFHAVGEYTAPTYMWCKFLFPMKKPSNGIYPYYDYCNVRDLSTGPFSDNRKEYYCYDKYYPIDTYDTFVTAFAFAGSYLRSRPDLTLSSFSRNNEQYKCCKLPYGYHLDYSRCMYKYSHDKWGEHYDENQMFVMKCDRDHVMTGIGKAESPDGQTHYVWIQCCPFFYNPGYVPLYATANLTYHLRAEQKPYRQIHKPVYSGG